MLQSQKTIALLSFILALAAIPTSARSGEFFWAPHAEYPETLGTVSLNGQIEKGDLQRLTATIGDKSSQTGMPLLFKLDSPGGNFEEALLIARFVREQFLATRVEKGAQCLSACALIFMAGSSFNNSFSSKDRVLHVDAKLGFHAPTLVATGGTFDSSDLESAYDTALEQLGQTLMAIARYQDESWANPLIKPSLINEMMLRHGANFYFIDTIGKAAEFEIDLDLGGKIIRASQAGLLNACRNTIANINSGDVAASQIEMFRDTKPKKRRVSRDKDGWYTGDGPYFFSYEHNRAKGRYCDVIPGNGESSRIGVRGAPHDGWLSVPNWYFGSPDQRLADLP